MEEFTIGDLGVFLGTVGGVITSILIILQKSHCKKIKICCFECVRNDPSEIPNQPNKNNPINPQQAIQGNVQENEDQIKTIELYANEDVKKVNFFKSLFLSFNYMIWGDV